MAQTSNIQTNIQTTQTNKQTNILSRRFSVNKPSPFNIKQTAQTSQPSNIQTNQTNIKNNIQTKQKTFHKRVLPDNLIALSSPQGT
jgi:hypothetical protein